MKEVIIASGVRTPIGAYCGMLREIPVEKLGALVLNEAVKQANVQPAEVDDVFLSQAYRYLLIVGRISIRVCRHRTEIVEPLLDPLPDRHWIMPDHIQNFQRMAHR